MPVLTHLGQVTHTCVGNLTTIGSDNGLSPDLNKIQWNFNRGSDIFIQRNAFESVVCEIQMAAILSRPQCGGK